MRKKIKFLLTLIIIGVTLCTFTACDFKFGNSTSSHQGNPGEKTERKISFSEAKEHYSDLKVKRADSEATLSVTLYLVSPTNKDKAEKHVISIVADTERRTDNQTSYADISVGPGKEISESVVGLLTAVKEAFSGKMPDLLSWQLDDEVKSTLSEISFFIEYIQGFLQGKVDLYARAGRRDGTTNFKTGYVYRRTNAEPEKGEGWYSVGDQLIKNMLGFDMATTDFADGLYPAAFFDVEKGKDVASERVKKDGLAEYDVNFTAQGIKNYIANLSQKITDSLDKDNEQWKNSIDLIAQGFSSWLDVEKSTSKFTATVGANKLPLKTRADSALAFNIDTQDFRGRIKNLKERGLISASTADTMNVLVYLLSTQARGINGEVGKIGVEISFSAEESYLYDAADCSFDGIDDEMFVSENEDGDRIKIEDFFIKLTESEATAFLGEALSPLGETANEIVEVVKTNLGTLKNVTLADLKRATFNALNEYVAENEEIQERINEIKKEFFLSKK